MTAEASWYELAYRMADASRHLLAESESMLRFFRSEGGPLWTLHEIGLLDEPDRIPSFRTALKRIESTADPVSLVEGTTTGRDLQRAVRLIRRYRALKRAVKRARAAHKAVWFTKFLTEQEAAS